MPRQFYQVNSTTRINQLQEYAGPWRVAAGQDTFGSDSESDSSGEEDDGCHETLGPPPTIARQHNNQKRPNHCRKKQNASADNCLTRVSQAAPREYTYPRESSGARSGPPSPWGTGETKKRIVDALKNELSDIHLYTGDITTNSCAKVNYARIRQMYAPKHEMKKFRPNFKRLIESKIAMKGPFEMKAKASKEIEPWYTSSKNTSLAYTLLHDMYRFNTSKINSMKAEDIWKSHPQFRQYPIDDFKKYNKNMKILVSKKVMRAATEDATYLEDMQHHPEKIITCRGTPFWNKHAARKMLIKDVQDGFGRSMGPKELWKLRKEYQDFPYDFFRKRVYEVRNKELAGPYWQTKRNKNGRELHRLETDKMRKEWAYTNEVEAMIDIFRKA